MSEKRFKYVLGDGFSDGFIHLSATEVCELLNEQQSTISRLEAENEKLQKETVFLAYWKRKAMTLLMQVRRLTPRMTDEEVMEFAKELEDE